MKNLHAFEVEYIEDLHLLILILIAHICMITTSG